MGAIMGEWIHERAARAHYNENVRDCPLTGCVKRQCCLRVTNRGEALRDRSSALVRGENALPRGHQILVHCISPPTSPRDIEGRRLATRAAKISFFDLKRDEGIGTRDSVFPAPQQRELLPCVNPRASS
jgi:hypothetical protein